MKVKKKPFVGISQCLLGDAVRYDGQSKANTIVNHQLKPLFELVAVCPEVEAGLSVPRPPVQLTNSVEAPILSGRDDPAIDITNIMQQYCNTKPTTLAHLSGFIFKSHSPSCGLNSTPVFIDGECITETSRGLFTRKLLNRYPNLPVIEDAVFSDATIKAFIKSVGDYQLQK